MKIRMTCKECDASEIPYQVPEFCCRGRAAVKSATAVDYKAEQETAWTKFALFQTAERNNAQT